MTGERRLYLRVTEEVMRSLAVGALSAGDRLPNERELAVRCSVSRPTVREALIALELSGVIEIRPRSGCYLTGLGVPPGRGAIPTAGTATPGDSLPRDLLEARQAVEPVVARLSAGHIRPDGLGRLRAMVDEAEALSARWADEDREQFVRLNLAFHRELAATCGNAVLGGLVSHLVDAGEHPLWTLVDGIATRDEGVRAKQVEEHRGIVEALGHGRGGDAADAMTRHLGAMSSRFFGPDQDRPKVTRARRHHGP